MTAPNVAHCDAGSGSHPLHQWRNAFDGQQSGDHYVANGEVGLVGSGKSPWLNVIFAGRPNLRFGYSGRDFPGGSGPLELAYAITVHKSQGSEYPAVVLVSAPAAPSLMVRGVLYTAITRARRLLVLVGDDGTPVKMAANDRQQRRYSGLRRRLKEGMA